jgi:hypothetical protein
MNTPHSKYSVRLLALFLFLLQSGSIDAQQRDPKPLFNMQEMENAATLAIEVLQDWHVVGGDVATRQKLITIRVGELVPEKAYRVPVRMIIPANRKAHGFHLTGGHNPAAIRNDARPRGVERELLNGGVGLVYTIVQVLQQSGQGELGQAADRRFLQTLDPHSSIQYWGWPATLMRAVTAAHAEEEHFEVGKIALSGGSKNGASPSVAIIHDKRMTALHASVSPIWDSPLRLCDRAAWDRLRAENQRFAAILRERNPRVNAQRLLNHPFLGGTFGPVYNAQALAAGRQWKDLQQLAFRMAEDVFISRNLEALRARDVDLYFQPGTHDFVAFDIAWGGEHHPTIPLYLGVNSGHGQRSEHPGRERGQQNKAAFLLEHFFEEVQPLLEAPSVKYVVNGRQLSVTITFKPGSKAESGRIWWTFDRGSDGSAAYITELFPQDQWKEMTGDDGTNSWAASIPLADNVSRVDFFSNHRKTIEYRSRKYPSYLSSPYTRVTLENK